MYSIYFWYSWIILRVYKITLLDMDFILLNLLLAIAYHPIINLSKMIDLFPNSILLGINISNIEIKKLFFPWLKGFLYRTIDCFFRMYNVNSYF